MKTGLVVYYPAFSTQQDFDNHYHRALWYLPREEGVLEEVVLGVADRFALDRRPSYMCTPRQPTDHVRAELQGGPYEQALCDAQLVLVWQRISQKELAAFDGKRILNVTTDDIDAIEYGNYCKVHWHLNSTSRRKTLLSESHARFLEVRDRIVTKKYEAALVLGTGPSIEMVTQYNVENLFAVACNSIVQDQELLLHIRPDFLTAGDAISHFGVSLYAERFREDLSAYLSAHQAVFLTTAQFGNLLRLQYPELAHKILLCEQTSDTPIFDLVREWRLPKLDSTLNIHMLPLAATFSDTIYIVGCDGKNPDPDKNEDFWAHSKKTQYHHLVETGHQAHPTFEQRRQKLTHPRYLDSTEATLSCGECDHGKKYWSLAPSFTPSIGRRLIPQASLPIEAATGLRKLGRRPTTPAMGPAVFARPQHILIVGLANARVYSGGRYQSFMAGEALAARGHQVTIWVPECPPYWKDLACLPAHKSIELRVTPLTSPIEARYDAVFVIPDMEWDSGVCKAALTVAQRDSARVILFSFETPNWFNNMSPAPRDVSRWHSWERIAACSDVVLTLTREGSRYAGEFYKDLAPHSVIRHCYPPINTMAAEAAASIKPENQIIVISRLGGSAAHKGIDDVTAIIDPIMSGYTLCVVVGTGRKPGSSDLQLLRQQCAAVGMKLKLLHAVSDEEKFAEIARSRFMVFPSYFEGYGYPPVEALYVGRPCIAYDLPVLREVSGSSLIYVPVGDREALREAVIRLASEASPVDPECLRRNVADVASVDRFGEQLEGLLYETLTCPAQPAALRYESPWINGPDAGVESAGQTTGKALPQSPHGKNWLWMRAFSPRRVIYRLVSGLLRMVTDKAPDRIVAGIIAQPPLRKPLLSALVNDPSLRVTVAEQIASSHELLSFLIRRWIRTPDTIRSISEIYAGEPKAVRDTVARWLKHDNLQQEIVQALSADEQLMWQLFEAVNKSENAAITFVTGPLSARMPAMSSFLEMFGKCRPYLSKDVLGDLDRLREEGLRRTARGERPRQVLADLVTISGNQLGLDPPLRFAHKHDLPTLIQEILVDESYRFDSEDETPLIIDAGANIGLAVYYFKKIYPAARIKAFEPNPLLVTLLDENVRTHNMQDVEIFPFALDVREREATLHVPADMPMGGSLSKRITPDDPSVTRYGVKCHRLSPYLQEPVELLKLDIEGPEVEVLEECESALANVRHLFCEIHFGHDLSSDRLPRILGVLERAGFRYTVGSGLAPPSSDDTPSPFRIAKAGRSLIIHATRP